MPLDDSQLRPITVYINIGSHTHEQKRQRLYNYTSHVIRLAWIPEASSMARCLLHAPPTGKNPVQIRALQIAATLHHDLLKIPDSAKGRSSLRVLTGCLKLLSCYMYPCQTVSSVEGCDILCCRAQASPSPWEPSRQRPASPLFGLIPTETGKNGFRPCAANNLRLRCQISSVLPLPKPCGAPTLNGGRSCPNYSSKGTSLPS